MKKQIKNEFLTVETATRNGELTSIRTRDGLEYLWQGDPAYWNGQAPILFPICGAVRDGRTNINGSWYEMPKHGIARRVDYELADCTEDSVTYVLQATEASKQHYPFDFELTVTYKLEGSAIHHIFTVRNNDIVPMPFTLGAHPAFCCPLLPGEAFEDYEVVFDQEETTFILALDPVSLLADTEHPVPFLDHQKVWKPQRSPQLQDALILPEVKSRAVTLRHPVTGKGVRVSYPDMNYLLLWSPKDDAPFLALEPWSGLPTCTDEGDDFASKRGMRIIQPGETATLELTIEIM